MVKKIDKEIERLRKTTAVRAAHLATKPEMGEFIEDAFNASAKREAINLLQSAVSAEKMPTLPRSVYASTVHKMSPCSDKI